LCFCSSAFGVVHAKSQAAERCEENDMKVAAPHVPSLANQPELEKDDILSDFSEKTESISSFGGFGGGDSIGSFASKTAAAAADLVVTKPELRRLKKRKEQQSNTVGSTTTSSVAPNKRRRVSALGESLASLEMASAGTTEKVKGNTTSKHRTATRKTY
jgi:hypothetical protein